MVGDISNKIILLEKIKSNFLRVALRDKGKACIFYSPDD
jgi:hypothetical protein